MEQIGILGHSHVRRTYDTLHGSHCQFGKNSLKFVSRGGLKLERIYEDPSLLDSLMGVDVLIVCLGDNDVPSLSSVKSTDKDIGYALAYDLFEFGCWAESKLECREVIFMSLLPRYDRGHSFDREISPEIRFYNNTAYRTNEVLKFLVSNSIRPFYFQEFGFSFNCEYEKTYGYCDRRSLFEYDGVHLLPHSYKKIYYSKIKNAIIQSNHR